MLWKHLPIAYLIISHISFLVKYIIGKIGRFLWFLCFYAALLAKIGAFWGLCYNYGKENNRYLGYNLAMKKKIFACLATLLMGAMLINTMIAVPTYASGGDECANLLTGFCNGDSDDILELIGLVVGILTAGVVIAGTVGIIWCGFLMLSARDNEAQVAQAKKRLIDIVIGIVVFTLAAFVIGLILPNADGSWFN